ncbi:MAG: HAD-IIA family hydrolase [Planctomycetota bacterium]|nr:HAD-IIA family hydrolase [Planctomycetota bacterium]
MKAFLLDIDGTTLLGPEALPGAKAFVAWLRAEGIPFLWLTNNTSLSKGGWQRRLAAAGLDPRAAEIYTAGDATIDYLATRERPPRIHLVGTQDLRRAFNASGLVLDDRDPEAVVLGYDTELTYEKLREAALFLQKGLPFFATHPDDTCPTPEGPVPDVGAFLALFERATGRTARVLGKPEATMVEGALGRLGVPASEACAIGDRLATDIRMANRGGLTSCLVLSGVTAEADLEGSDDRPDHVFATIEGVHAWARELR